MAADIRESWHLKMMMLIGFGIGAMVGVLIISLFAANSYEKGYEDGKRNK